VQHCNAHSALLRGWVRLTADTGQEARGLWCGVHPSLDPVDHRTTPAPILGRNLPRLVRRRTDRLVLRLTSWTCLVGLARVVCVCVSVRLVSLVCSCSWLFALIWSYNSSTRHDSEVLETLPYTRYSDHRRHCLEQVDTSRTQSTDFGRLYYTATPSHTPSPTRFIIDAVVVQGGLPAAWVRNKGVPRIHLTHPLRTAEQQPNNADRITSHRGRRVELARSTFASFPKARAGLRCSLRPLRLLGQVKSSNIVSTSNILSPPTIL
jgi:hypothetical protein